MKVVLVQAKLTDHLEKVKHTVELFWIEESAKLIDVKVGLILMPRAQMVYNQL